MPASGGRVQRIPCTTACKSSLDVTSLLLSVSLRIAREKGRQTRRILGPFLPNLSSARAISCQLQGSDLIGLYASPPSESSTRKGRYQVIPSIPQANSL